MKVGISKVRQIRERISNLGAIFLSLRCPFLYFCLCFLPCQEGYSYRNGGAAAIDTKEFFIDALCLV